MEVFKAGMRGSDTSDSSDNELMINEDDPMPIPLPVAPKQAISNSAPMAQFSKPQTNSITDAVGKAPTVHKRFSLWTDVLMEQTLTESMNEKMKVKATKHKNRRLKMNRSSEDYPYWKKEKDPLKGSTSSPGTSAKKEKKKGKTEEFLADRNIKISDINRKRKRNMKKKERKHRSEDEKAALKIANKLNEQKIDLIRKVVAVIGVDKTHKVCSDTLNVEEVGGMMTNNGTRRRSPGGVFFQLLKHDQTLTDDQKTKIFEVDDGEGRAHKKLKRRDRRKIGKTNEALGNFSLSTPGNELQAESTSHAADSQPKPCASIDEVSSKLAQSVQLALI